MKLEEILHITASVITISLAFSLFNIGNFFPVLIIIGTGFVFHELAHKYVAISYGIHAEYRAWTLGLVAAVAMAVITQGQFIFAAPGAVYHAGGTREQVGKIAWAGPMTNLILAILFLILAMSVPAISGFAVSAAYINAFLGAMNMLPFFIFDGAKVMRWSQQTWLFTMLTLLGLTLFIGGLKIA